MTSVFAVEDFTGGLNLRADVFNIGKNESPDLLNVDIDPRGGVQQRAGTEYMNDTAIGGYADGTFEPHRLFHWRRANQQLILAANDKVFYATETNFSDAGITTTQEYGAEFAEWIGADNYLYVACGAGTQSVKWNDTVATSLTVSGSGQWQDDLLTPSGTHMPTADHVATHVDRLWVASTQEDSTDFPDRVRWSHPLFPESWRENDYIDVVGGGVGIRALVPFSNHILVFKDRAVFAIYGYNEATFQLIPLTQELGTYSSQTVAVSEKAVFFFSWPDGLFAYNGSGFTDVFSQLRPIVDRNEINRNALNAVHVDWVGRRVHLSLPVGTSPDDFENYDDTDLSGTVYDDYLVKYDGYERPPIATASFVYDPSVGKNGAWTRYRSADGYGMICGTDYTTPAGVSSGYFCSPYEARVLRFNTVLHTDPVNTVATNFNGYYTMGWQDLGQPQAKKFWRAPEFIVSRVSNSYTLDVDVFHDWNTFNYDRRFSVPFTANTVGIPDDLEQWTEYYGSDTVRGDTLGSARSVQVRFGSSGAKWGVNGVVFRYSFRKVRV